jgi:undecaprenyl-diphosphatase
LWHVPLVVHGGAVLLAAVTKIVVRRHGPRYLADHPGSWWNTAFPSGHVTAVAAIVVGAAVLLPRLDVDPPGVVARRPAALAGAVAAWVIAVAGSRVVLDVHWVSDVVAGLVLGGAWAVLAVRGTPSLPFTPAGVEPEDVPTPQARTG